ncbi:MAG TPA: asparagine synthase (glutamine-hydrolyzing) [Pyrinomonadaceae bacterium]|nr:asparagine synthase (glutamine-hydrolyzing) [Pyrinomonadaceae bacterium]
MCGIFGIHYSDEREINLCALERSTTALRHRGPDDEGYLLVDTRAEGRTVLAGGRDTRPEMKLSPVNSHTGVPFNLAFGFRRLSILDLSVAGHQPMASADKTCWIIFNGEIYNYIELRQELIGHGYEFQTGTDTEVVLAAYRHWGTDCLKRFTGMWAFALLDRGKRQLFLARDPFGIKPLYYARNDKRFVFASEIKAILASGEVSRKVNPQRLYDYLVTGLTDQGGETLFEEIRQLPSAHSLIIPLDNPRAPVLERYWQINLDNRLDLTFDEAAARLREMFLESVKLHLRSDVRVGAALSGGIDSSAITMGMRALEPGLALHTFSYTADDPAVNEERWLDMVVEAAHSVGHKVRPTPAELVADIDRLIAAQDEPFGSTSIYAQQRVFRLAREAGITVMLDGQGADELLAGYRTYLVARLASLLSQGRLLQANRLAGQAATMPEIKRATLLAAAGGMLFPSMAQGKMLPSGLRRFVRGSLGMKESAATALNNAWFADREVGQRLPANGRNRDYLRKTLHETLVETSLPMLLRYEDRNSMAHSIESRVPFLTTSLAEFIMALPEEHLVAGDATSKSVFRKAMRGIVPDAVLDRRDKIGFATPERQWLTTLRPWVEDVLNSDTARQMPALNIEAIKREWEGILAGQKSFDFRVWRWLNAIRWTEAFQVSF